MCLFFMFFRNRFRSRLEMRQPCLRGTVFFWRAAHTVRQNLSKRRMENSVQICWKSNNSLSLEESIKCLSITYKIKMMEAEIKIYQSCWKNLWLILGCMLFTVGGIYMITDESCRLVNKIIGGWLGVIFSMLEWCWKGEFWLTLQTMQLKEVNNSKLTFLI